MREREKTCIVINQGMEMNGKKGNLLIDGYASIHMMDVLLPEGELKLSTVTELTLDLCVLKCR